MHLVTCTVMVGDCCGYAWGYAYALYHLAGAQCVPRLCRTVQNESLSYIRYRIVVKGYWFCCLCLIDLFGVNPFAVSLILYLVPLPCACVYTTFFRCLRFSSCLYWFM